jgi:Dolichyl-phosphate-mannose-protein mannosyltransferase
VPHAADYHRRATRRVPDIARRSDAVALVLLVLGSALIAAGRLADSVLRHEAAGIGWKQASAIVLGAVLLVAGMAVAPLSDEDDRPGRAALFFWLALGLLGAIVVWTRLAGLNQSLWHDEVFSVVHYVDLGPSTIVSGDYVPNDHVLFNLLGYGTTRVLGESEVTLRLWSVLPAIAAAALIVWWTWRLRGRWTALVVAVLVATSPVHHDLAREARGYGLMFLAGALMLVFSHRVVTQGDRSSWIALALAGVIGSYTAPQFVLGFVGQTIPLLVRRDLQKRALVLLGVVGGVLLLLYSPLLSDIARSPGTVSGGPLPGHAPVSGPILHLVQPSFDLLADRATDAYVITPNTPDRILGGLLVLIGALVLWRANDRMVCALLIVPLLFVYTVLTIGRFHVHERYGSFLLLHALVLVAIGIVGLVRASPRGVPRWLAGAVAAAAGVALSINSIDRSDRYQSLPREDFKRVGEIVRARGETKVVTDSARPDGLRYYLGEENVAPVTGSACVSPPTVFISHPFRGEGESPPADVSCLRVLGAVKVRVPQRDRGGHIDIWFPPGAGGPR